MILSLKYAIPLRTGKRIAETTIAGIRAIAKQEMIVWFVMAIGSTHDKEKRYDQITTRRIFLRFLLKLSIVS